MARLMSEPSMQFFDDSGNPLAGGKIYTYETGTSTNKATYTDADAGTANANPVILDAAGRGDIWLLTDAAYRIVVKDSSDTTISTTDNVVPVLAGDDIDTTLSGALTLGGNLDVSTYSIVSSSDRDINITPNGSGSTVIKRLKAVDGNLNESIITAQVASAVNEFTITNAATTNGPTLAATGDDTNIDMNITPKGSGSVILNGPASADVTLTLDGSSSATGEIRFAEDTDNGTNYMGFKAPAAVTSSLSLELPDGDGSAEQILKTDGSGVLAWSDASSLTTSGKILQVLQTTKTDTFSTSSTSFVDITGLSQAITPASTSNKVLVTAAIFASTSANSDTGFLNVLRDSTNLLVGDSASNRVQCTQAVNTSGNSGRDGYSIAICYLDSPSSTSSLTYKIQGRAQSSSNLKINDQQDGADTTSNARCASVITVMEISG